jgi:hypothetical protein
MILSGRPAPACYDDLAFKSRKERGIMGHNDHWNEQLIDAIEDLVDEGYIEKPSKEYGVAQQVIHQGEGSLSPAQRVVWEQGLIPALKNRGEELEVQNLTRHAPE